MSDSGSQTRIYQPTLQARTIAALNDELRRDHRKGVIAVTRGVLEIGRGQMLPAVMAMVAAYDNFTEDNDPYGEHDFGALDCAGHHLFWKIDYYNRDMTAGSPNPADPVVTTRVLTIMLRQEY